MELDELFSVRNLFWLGNYETAIEEAEQVVPSNDREAIDRDVFVFRSMIGLGQAAKVIDKVQGQASTDVLSVKLLAQFTAQPAQADAVRETFKEWLSDDVTRDNQTVQLMAGLVYFLSGDTKEALRALHSRGNLEHSALRVQIYLSMNRVDLARNELVAMQSIDDDSTLTQLANAWVYLASGGPKYQEAAYIFQEQIDKTVSTARLLNGLAVCNMQMKRFEEAERVLAEAHQKDPRDPDVIVNLLSCMANLRRPAAKSQALVQKLGELAPGHPVLVQLQQCSSSFDEIAAAVKASTA